MCIKFVEQSIGVQFSYNIIRYYVIGMLQNFLNYALPQ